MKVVAFLLLCGMAQCGIDGLTSLFPAPHRVYKKEIAPVEQRWECSACGHNNYDWTSICGFCGRSKGR